MRVPGAQADRTKEISKEELLRSAEASVVLGFVPPVLARQLYAEGSDITRPWTGAIKDSAKKTSATRNGLDFDQQLPVLKSQRRSSGPYSGSRAEEVFVQTHFFGSDQGCADYLKTIEEAGVGALFYETTDALLAHGLPPSLKQNSTRKARGWESGCSVGYALAPRSSVVLSPSFPWSPSLHPSSPPPPPPPRASSVFASSLSDSAPWWSGIALSDAALAKLQALASALQDRNVSKAQAGARDYSVYLLYWYKITNTDERRQAGARDFFREFGTHALPGTGTLSLLALLVHKYEY